MEYKRLDKADAEFLTTLFSQEYDLYFAENETTAEDWVARMVYFDHIESFVVSVDSHPIGWIMYSIKDAICSLDILVLLPSQRHKGYGTAILFDLLIHHPSIRTITLDVQKRNVPAYDFYQKFGFHVIQEETQPVGDGFQEYYKMRIDIQRL